MHKGLLYSLKCKWINGLLCSLLGSFLTGRQKAIVLNWKNVRVGLPQVSVLSPLLTLIYINDLPGDLHASIKLFADDAFLSSVVDDIDKSASKINNYSMRIHAWVY